MIPILLLTLVCATEVQSQNHVVNYGVQFHHMMLTIQWPGSYCKLYGNCRPNVPNSWTIHGLWPSDWPGNNHPANCFVVQTPQGNVSPQNWPTRNWAINQCQNQCAVPNIRGMATVWPNLRGIDSDFWKYEYCKHGTCANDYLPTPSQYFRKAMDLYNALLVQKPWIRNSQSQRYNFHPTALDNVGKKGQFKCALSLGQWYLKEVGYCYNVTQVGNTNNVIYDPIDCPDTGNCHAYYNYFYLG